LPFLVKTSQKRNRPAHPPKEQPVVFPFLWFVFSQFLSTNTQNTLPGNPAPSVFSLLAHLNYFSTRIFKVLRKRQHIGLVIKNAITIIIFF